MINSLKTGGSGLQKKVIQKDKEPFLSSIFKSSILD